MRRFLPTQAFIYLMIFSRIPSAFPGGLDGPVEIKVISGKSHGVESPVRPQGGCWYFHIIFKRKASVFQDIRMKSFWIFSLIPDF